MQNVPNVVGLLKVDLRGHVRVPLEQLEALLD